MCFLFKLSSILLLAGVYADSVEYFPAYGIVGENPLGNLDDLDSVVRDESSLNALSGQSLNLMSQKTCSRSLLTRGREDVKFMLYNKNYPFGFDISDDLGEGKLLPRTPIKFLIHGFLNGKNSEMEKTVKDAYMARSEDYNVIAVDWTKGSGRWISDSYDCLVTARVTSKVADAVASFIFDLLSRQGVNILYVNVIGHGLGAQIAGVAGKKLRQLGQTLPIIVGLDPVLPGFRDVSPMDRLSFTDAEYVEVIHSSPGDLGFETPIGTADFYPNYNMQRGNRQPGCSMPACSHARAFELFAESIMNPTAFEAKKCSNYEALKQGECRENTRSVYMGGNDMRVGKQSGVFKIETNNYSPYGKSFRM
ncbi:phospholipase A1-like [Culicoides brevitarsis]|uniref:phospholipase A1-like n=1 Tax=Culicoides brevitarsis TaxID=469753 RepID=UPI00307B3553